MKKSLFVGVLKSSPRRIMFVLRVRKNFINADFGEFSVWSVFFRTSNESEQCRERVFFNFVYVLKREERWCSLH